MVRGEEVQSVGEEILGAVCEAVFRFAGDHAAVQEVGKIAVECDLSETDYDSDAGERLDFSGEMGGTVANLLRQRLVAGRGAADDGRNPGMAKFEAVFTVNCTGLAGKAEFVQDGIHEVARAVSGKGAACPVGPVGAGGEPKNEDPGAGVAKAGNGSGPVGLVLVGSAFSFADATAVVAKTGTTFTGDDGFMNLLEGLGRYLCVGGCHCIP